MTYIPKAITFTVPSWYNGKDTTRDQNARARLERLIRQELQHTSVEILNQDQPAYGFRDPDQPIGYLTKTLYVKQEVPATDPRLIKGIRSDAEIRGITPDDILNAVAKRTGISRNDMQNGRYDHRKEVVSARHLAIYILRQAFNGSLPKIGEYIGMEDHTTVLNALRKFGTSGDREVFLRNDLAAMLNAALTQRLVQEAQGQQQIPLSSNSH